MITQDRALVVVPAAVAQAVDTQTVYAKINELAQDISARIFGNSHKARVLKKWFKLGMRSQHVTHMVMLAHMALFTLDPDADIEEVSDIARLSLEWLWCLLMWLDDFTQIADWFDEDFAIQDIHDAGITALYILCQINAMLDKLEQTA